MLNKLVKLSILSGSMKLLVTEDGSFSTRPQLNLLLVSPFGSGKSSLLKGIEKEGYAESISEYTRPGMLFSVKGDKITKGAVFRGAGKTITIDEFQKIPSEERDIMLNLMEDQTDSRSLGVDVGYHKEEGDYYSILSEGSYIKIKIQASYIISTMYFKKKRIEDIALMSRCFPINLSFSKTDAIDLFMGYSPIDLKGIDEKLDKTQGAVVTVTDDAKKYLVKILKPLVEKTQLEAGFFSRMFWDITRIAAIFASIEEQYTVREKHMKDAAVYAPYEISGFSQVMLSQKDIEIYAAVKNNAGITPSKISEITGYSRNTVKVSLSNLIHYRLLKKVQMGKEVYYYMKNISVGKEDLNE